MYEELVGDLRYCDKGDCNGCRRYTKETRFCNALLREAADAIEELQEDNSALNGTVSNLIGQIAELSKPNWIPVTERLPEECIPVLVCFDFKGRKSVDVAELWSDGGFHNYSDEYLTPEGRKYRKGTHWMPLPPATEPPKEKA